MKYKFKTIIGFTERLEQEIYIPIGFPRLKDSL